MSSLHLIKQKFPITTYQELDFDVPFNLKYAPKYLNYLNIFDKEKMLLRTRYIKKISFLRCPNKSWSQGQEEWKPILLKICKRLSKFCKGQEDLDPKFLSSFLSLEKCRLTSVSSLPFYFKIGRFPKLTLEFEMVSMNVLVPKPQISKIVRNINRFQLLKDLHIKFDENTLDIAIPLLLELQRYPNLISSLHSFGLHYKNSQHDEIGNFQNSLINLKRITQSVTHLFFNIETDQISNLILQDFKKLNSLKVTFTPSPKSHFLKLIPLDRLTNLETFILRTPLNTQQAVEGVLKNFRLPKSIKKLGLIRTGDMHEDFLPLTQFIKEDNIPLKKISFASLILCRSSKTQKSQTQKNKFQKPSMKKIFEEFYKRWKGLNQLSDLTLSFQNNPESSDADFLFIAPILQRCSRLKRLAITTACSSSCIKSHSSPAKHSGNLQWAQILEALGPSKDTLEDLKIEACKVNFCKEGEPSDFILKNLKNLSLTIRTMETKDLYQTSSIIPKGLSKCRFESEDIILHNEKEITEVFNSLKEIPKCLQMFLTLFFSKEITSEIVEKALLNYLSSAKIHGCLSLDFYSIVPLNPQQLQKLIKHTLSLAWTGYLNIYYPPFGTIFEFNRTSIPYSF